MFAALLPGREFWLLRGVGRWCRVLVAGGGTDPLRAADREQDERGWQGPIQQQVYRAGGGDWVRGGVDGAGEQVAGGHHRDYEAFSKNTWARRHEARGPEMTAWRRAAAFLDGGVFCGCPERDI